MINKILLHFARREIGQLMEDERSMNIPKNRCSEEKENGPHSTRGVPKNPIRNIRSGLPYIRFLKSDNLPDFANRIIRIGYPVLKLGTRFGSGLHIFGNWVSGIWFYLFIYFYFFINKIVMEFIKLTLG